MIQGKEKAPQRKSLQSLIFPQSGRRDLNSTASMRGRCFFGTYAYPRYRMVRYGHSWTGKHYGKHCLTINVGTNPKCERGRRYGEGSLVTCRTQTRLVRAPQSPAGNAP